MYLLLIQNEKSKDSDCSVGSTKIELQYLNEKHAADRLYHLLSISNQHTADMISDG